MDDKNILLQVNGLKKYFNSNHRFLNKTSDCYKAVDDISFYIRKGETLGLVGESGCGKTTVGRMLLRLHKPTAGEILFEGKDIAWLSEKELLPYRKKIQMIFQDPYASLNPRMTVKDIVGEPIDIHNIAKGREREGMIIDLLQRVGLNRDHSSRYPYEFSGGQRQRIGIARALAVKPDFIICDEPISALDVSIQAQIVNILDDLQDEFGLTYLFIAHDLSVVRYISDRVGVMYLGKLVEVAECKSLYKNPQHPYTRALLSSISTPDPDHSMLNKIIKLEGEIPSSIAPPSGCKFRTRCRYKMEICSFEVPHLKDIDNEHFVACHLIK